MFTYHYSRGHTWFDYELADGESVNRVWVEEGCLVCNCCEELCPEVLWVSDESCLVQAEARVDASQDRNVGRVLLLPQSHDVQQRLIEAYVSCPMDVIRLGTSRFEDITQYRSKKSGGGGRSCSCSD